MGLFDFFKPSDERVFWKKINSASKAFEITAANPFLVSMQKQEDARATINDLKDWWLNNRERLKDQEWMNENIWFETNKALGLPMSAY
jgi:hypothetical protein